MKKGDSVTDDDVHVKLLDDENKKSQQSYKSIDDPLTSIDDPLTSSHDSAPPPYQVIEGKDNNFPPPSAPGSNNFPPPAPGSNNFPPPSDPGSNNFPPPSAPPMYSADVVEDYTLAPDQPPPQYVMPKGGRGCWNGYMNNPHLLATLLTLAVLVHLCGFIICSIFDQHSDACSYFIGIDGYENTWPAIFLVALFLYYLECCLSGTRKYLSSIKRDCNTREHIQNIKQTPPSISWHITCYHYETRVRIIHEKDSEGRSRTRRETYQERVNTHSATMYYQVHMWSDNSSLDISFDEWQITKCKFSKTYAFGSNAASHRYTYTKQNFKFRNNRDVHMDFTENFKIPGMLSRLLSLKPGVDISGLTISHYFICSLFLCTVPYRIWMEGLTGKLKYTYVKILLD